MGEVAKRALNPLPLAREVHALVLDRFERAERESRPHDAVPGGRLKFIRRVLFHLLGTPLERQSTFNREVVAALRDVEALTTILEERVKTGWTNLDHRIGGTQSEIGRVEAAQFDTAQSIAGSVAAVDLRINALEGALADAEEREGAALARVERLASELEACRTQLAVLRTKVSAVATPSWSADTVSAAATAPRGRYVPDLDLLYVDFEAEFRGAREEVMRRQEVYLEDVRQVPGPLPLLDVGPGRGEWLELLGANDIRAYGVDINPALAALAETYDVDVRIVDAIEHLSAVAEGSLRGVTAFHVVEHLEVNDVISLVDAALVALQPGGILIFETPNPTNLIVGSCGFYLDPTHLRPLHPELLEFLVRNRGFADVCIRYLHPVREVDPVQEGDALGAEIAWSLLGPQDYAVVATKPAAAH